MHATKIKLQKNKKIFFFQQNYFDLLKMCFVKVNKRNNDHVVFMVYYKLYLNLYLFILFKSFKFNIDRVEICFCFV